MFKNLFDKKVKENKKINRGRRSNLDLLSESLTNWISDGRFIKPNKLASVSIKAGYDKIFTKGLIRKSYAITDVPTYFEAYFVELIRKEMNSLRPNCKTIVVTTNETVEIPIHSKQFKAILASAHKRYQGYVAARDTLTEAERIAGKTVYIGGRPYRLSEEIEFRLEDEMKSCNYVHSRTTSSGTFTHASVIIDCIAKTQEEHNMYRKDLYNLLTSCQIRAKELKSKYGLLFEGFGFAGKTPNKGLTPPKILLSDENMAAMMSVNTDGLIGEGPILIGQEVNSRGPLTLDFKKSGKGQMFMLLGSTGSGKTYGGFQIIASLLNDNTAVSVIDIKGNEHIKIKALGVNPLRIAMDDKSARFVNTLRLDDYEVDTVDDAIEIYNDAVKATALLLKVMCKDDADAMPDIDIETILMDTVIKLYNLNGVYRDSHESFKNTKRLKYTSLLPILNEMITSDVYTVGQKEIGKLAFSRLTSIFSNEGRYSGIFKNELTLKEILDADMVIYEFNKNKDSGFDAMEAARMVMVQFLETKKHYHRKQLGLYSALLIEEVQRCVQFGDLVNYISQVVTGGRSNNTIVGLLLNSISVFEDKRLAPALSNISTYFIGSLTDKDIRELVEVHGMGDIEDMLRTVGENGSMVHGFVCKFNLGYTKGKCIYKVKFPEKYHNLLRTVDVKEGGL